MLQLSVGEGSPLKESRVDFETAKKILMEKNRKMQLERRGEKIVKILSQPYSNSKLVH